MIKLETGTPNILIVEDESIIASDLQRRLTDLGFSVIGACYDSTSALETLSEVRPDLVLMDISIPGKMDGISAAAAIRDLYNIPVVFMTGHGDQATLKRAAAADPYGYLLKPSSDEDLRVTIELGLIRHANRFPPVRMKATHFELSHADDKEEILGFLSSLEIFQDVLLQDLKLLAESARIEKLSIGERISSEADRDTPTFLVLEGRLALVKSSYEGKELTVDLIGPGDVLGLLGAVDQMPAAVAVQAQIASKVVILGRSQLSLLLEKYPELYKTVLQQLLHRLRNLQSSACALAYECVEVRIARALCQFWSLAEGDDISEGEATLHATRQEVADLAGTTLESAVRTMRSMASRGILSLGKKRHVGISDLDALKALASGNP